MYSCITKSDTHTKMSDRGLPEQDWKICPRDLTPDVVPKIMARQNKLSALLALKDMVDAIVNDDKDAFKEAAENFVVETVKAEFDPDNGVTLQLFDPENDFRLTSGEVLELVQDCFYRPPANLQIEVWQVKFGFKVSISLSH